MSVTSPSDPGCVGDLVAVGTVLDLGLQSVDPLHFPGYTPPEVEQESVRTWTIRLGGIDAVWIDCDFARTGGTLGVVAGEQIVRAYDSATALRRPVVATMSSAGARLEEGMLAMLQTARTAAAVARHRAVGQVTVAHFGSPTVGGACLSWISLADIRAADPDTTIGSKRMSAEDAYGAGLIDAIVPAEGRWQWVAGVLGKVRALPLALPEGRPCAPDGSAVPENPYARRLRCRAGDRPSALEWAAWLSEGWTELRGAQDVVRAGMAWINGQRVMVIATDRHASPDGLGVPATEGLQLAQRAIRLADRWGIPLLTLIDAPSVEAAFQSPEEVGAAQEAQTLLAMSELRSPSVALVVGEVGSTSGAGALTHTDLLLMLDGTQFWVLGPDAARPDGQRSEMIAAYRMGARDLSELGVADDVVAEDVALVRAAVVRGFADTVRGARDGRPDRATERALIWHRFETCLGDQRPR